MWHILPLINGAWAGIYLALLTELLSTKIILVEDMPDYKMKDQASAAKVPAAEEAITLPWDG